MERLTGIDASFLYMETPTLHMHTIKVAVLEPRAGRRLLARAREGRPPRAAASAAAVPPARGRGAVRLPPSGVDRGSRPSISTTTCAARRSPAPGGPRELDAVVSTIASVPLDRRRPLWELWLLDGLAGGRVAAVGKDPPRGRRRRRRGGDCSRTSWRPADDTLAAPARRTPVAPEPLPSRGRLLRDALRDHLRQLARLPGAAPATASGTCAGRRAARGGRRAVRRRARSSTRRARRSTAR